MGKLLNTYNDEFRRNVVALIRSGMKATQIADRLGISRYTIYDWVHSLKYQDVPPANEELIKALPVTRLQQQSLVPVTKTKQNDSPVSGSIKLSVGKLQIECNKDSLVTVFKALGESGVL